MGSIKERVCDNMTYTFDVKLFDNEIGESFERFSADTLEHLAKLCYGTLLHGTERHG